MTSSVLPDPTLKTQLPHTGERFGAWQLHKVVEENRQIRLLFLDDAGRTVQFRIARPGPGVRRGPFDLPGLSIVWGETALTYPDIAPLGKELQAKLARIPAAKQSLPDLWRLQIAEQATAPLDWRVRVPSDGEPESSLLDAIDPTVVRQLTLVVAPGQKESADAFATTLRARGFQNITFAAETTDTALKVDGSLESTVPGPTEGYADMALPHADANATWQQRARQYLLNHPERKLSLSKLIVPSELPPWPCTLPWTRLELIQDRRVGPCCADYQAKPFKDHTLLATSLWNGPAMQAFRRAMVPGNGTPTTCRATCPVLISQRERAGDVRLRGGPQVALDSQIALVEDLLAGRAEVRGSPLAVCLSTTSFCNYDCLMCECGAEGKLSDQLPQTLYNDLQTLLPGVQLIEANGGEPLASPTFREFLATLDYREFPQLEVNLITNGSYLTPKQLDHLAKVPFGNLTLSLNAASPDTYLLVNRGLPYARVRGHLDDLLARHKAGLRGELTYSMVILKQNYHEIEAFADLALQDGVRVRYMLPFRNRNESSVLTDGAMMLTAFQALQRVGARLLARGKGEEARDVLTNAQILLGRLDARIFTPM